jgi:glycosyltransferase involved in cell wall biosynthesis
MERVNSEAVSSGRPQHASHNENVTSPRVTVAIPTLNRLGYLKEALQSAQAQTYPNIEILISDNGSTDGTREFLRSVMGIRAYHQAQNVGMLPNWNACLHLASGDFFLLLSDDDILEPTAVERLVSPFLTGVGAIPGEKVGLTYCWTKIVDATGSLLSHSHRAPAIETGETLVIEFFRCRRSLYPCAILMRTGDLKELGGYQSDAYAVAADAHAWAQLAMRRGYAAFVDEKLAVYRMHPQNLTKSGGSEVWMKDMHALMSSTLEVAGVRQGLSDSQINRIKGYYLARVIDARIMQGFRAQGRLTVALREYYANRAAFMSQSTFVIPLLALLKMFLPYRWVRTLGRLRNL